MAKGFMEGVLSAIDATDTSGLIGEPGAVVDAQDLLDVIADKVADKLVAKAQLVNNGLTTEEGFALDARYGKTLADGLAQLNGNKTPFLCIRCKSRHGDRPSYQRGAFIGRTN